MPDKKGKDKDAQALPEGQAEKPKKKSKLKRMIIAIVLFVTIVAGSGIGAYWYFYLRTPASPSGMAEGLPADVGGGAAMEGVPGKAEASGGSSSPRIERQSDLPRSTGIVMPLPPITVNLADPAGRRYLKLGMEVEANADISEMLKANNARIRDSVIMLLAGKTYADVSSPDGKVLFKAEVAGRINQILGAQRIVRVYLTDFVVE